MDAATKIRALAAQYPDISRTALARMVGCSCAYVSMVMSGVRPGRTEEEREYDRSTRPSRATTLPRGGEWENEQ